MSSNKDHAMECISSVIIQILGLFLFVLHFWLSKSRKLCTTHFACI